MKASIKDIANAAGTSKSTVSNVLNGKKNMSAETRDRILEICREMNYFPNAAGRSLKSSRSRTVLFNYSDFDRSFYLRILAGVHECTVDRDYDLIICTYKCCEKYMRNNLTDGAIILDPRITNEMMVRAANEGYPIIVLDRVLEHPLIKSVVVNNYDPMRELVHGLVNRGYSHFAFLGGPETSDDSIERYKAFTSVMDENGIKFKKEDYFSGDFREKSGYQVANIIRYSKEKPQAIICANDDMAIGAIRCFRESGIKVPEDIAVTGFDDSEMAQMIGLTTIAIPNFERGFLAARHLIQNIENEKDVEPLRINAQVQWRRTSK